jgi:hypothetical protein
MRIVSEPNFQRCAGLALAAWLMTTPATARTQTGKADTSGAPGAEQQAQPEQKPEQKEADIQELRRRVELLAQEVEQLRSGEDTRTTLTPEQRRSLGLGPSAAAVYERKSGLSFAGYGEMLYENFAGENESGSRANAPASRIDFLRAILYTGYRFSDRFIFNSEIEVEHAREIWVEFAYVDFKVNDTLTLRGGLLLVPLGLVNEFHEPNVFIGARRPLVEQQIIPSTWRENGFGAVGAFGRVNYRAYVVNGFNGSGFSSAGLRGGRQRGAEARAADWAFAGRIDVSLVPGTFVGGGLYSGGSDQALYPGVDVGTTIGEVHAQTQVRGFDLRALYARAMLDDVAGLNRVRNLTGASGIGELQQGGYAQIGYNVLSQTAYQTALTPYYRFEKLDTHAEVPSGFVSDRSRNITAHTFGLELKPINNIVVKADYQRIGNKARTGRDQFNIALGYSF